MIFFAKVPNHRPPSPGPEEVAAASLRALTFQPRALVLPLLAEALEDCGCWVRERSGHATGLSLCLEVTLYAVAELYSSLIECGLEFDRRGHGELALLCTLRRHAILPDALRRTFSIRLEVTFADELSTEPVRNTVASA